MDSLSPELVEEIERRVAGGPYASANELVQVALSVLDQLDSFDIENLEAELLAGLDGDEVDLTPEDLAEIRREAIEILDAKKQA